MDLIAEKDTPIRFVKNYAKVRPGVYDLLYSITEQFHAEYQNIWPNWCYMPTSVAAQLMEMDNKGGYKNEYSNICAGLVTCAMWRKYKIIYRPHPDLLRLLCNQAEDISDMDSIPVKIILENMPYPVLYIQCDDIKDGCNGFFAWVDSIEYATFRKVGGEWPNGVWEYCGHCFRGEIEERGQDMPYVAASK